MSTIQTKEHYDLMAQFENDYRKQFRLDKEPKELWPKGCIYQHGMANQLFLAYRKGFAYGEAVSRQ
jgi:hypothetical protein